jgi:hypothetical protein
MRRLDVPIRPIRLIVASCTFSCRFLKIGVMRGTGDDTDTIILAFAGLERSKGLTQILDRWIHLRHSNHVGDSSFSSDDTRSPSRISTEVRHNLRATELTATYLPSVSGYSSPRCSKSTTPNLLSRPSSPQFLITTASLAARSAACIRTLALLLVNRHRIVDTICVRYGLARMPSNRKGADQCGFLLTQTLPPDRTYRER